MSMREYAEEHGWEVGSRLRLEGSTTPSYITHIGVDEIRISTPGDFPGVLTSGDLANGDLSRWTIDWQYRALKAEAEVQKLSGLLERADTEIRYLRYELDREQ